MAENASGGSARAAINAGSTFDVKRLSRVGTTIGSLSGAGQVNLRSKALAIGGSGASTTFSGLIADGGQSGGSSGQQGVAPGTLTNGTVAFAVTGVPEPGSAWLLLAAGGGSWVACPLAAAALCSQVMAGNVARLSQPLSAT